MTYLFIFALGCLVGSVWECVVFTYHRQQRLRTWKLRRGRRRERRGKRSGHTLCLIRCGRKKVWRYVIRNDRGDWEQTEALCMELFAEGQLRIGEMHGIDECIDVARKR